MTQPENKIRRKANKSMIGRTNFRSRRQGKKPVLDLIGRRARDYYDEVAMNRCPTGLSIC